MTSIFVSIPSPGGKFGERGNNWGVNGGVDGIKWPRCCKSCKSKDNATTISLLLLNRRTHQARVLCDFRDIYKKGWWLRGAYSLKNGWKAPNCRWPPSPLVSGKYASIVFGNSWPKFPFIEPKICNNFVLIRNDTLDWGLRSSFRTKQQPLHWEVNDH